ncbi:hypothetical protein [Sanguibacter sp. HDW7]|uniref:hypothetical protein n=1 Tax=Sanguibacter sp. HDW7 TaxID=2714931 RepID=UPI00140CD59F|nr:hypothetical protein [Sanguibacter sp. HDW7]QIK82518.1 hypothetical protein G7063_01960 [Sanguibacter sp. HDW7]
MTLKRVDVADARTPTIGEVELVETMERDGTYVDLKSLGSDGTHVVALHDARAAGSAATTLARWTRGTVTPLDNALSTGGAWTSATAHTEGDIVWAEDTAEDYFANAWRIFASPFPKGWSPRLLADSAGVVPEGAPAAVGTAVPVISAERVWWHAAYEREDGQLRTRVVSVPLAGGDLREELVQAALPTAVDGGVVVAVMADVTADDGSRQHPRAVTGLAKIDASGGVSEIVRFDPVGGDDRLIHPVLGAAQSLVVGLADRLTVIPVDGTGPGLEIQGPEGTTLAGVAACGNVATWTYTTDASSVSTDQYLLDLVTHDLVRVPVEHGNSRSHCAGDLVAWDEFPRGADLDDVDTRTVTKVFRWTPSPSARAR